MDMAEIQDVPAAAAAAAALRFKNETAERLRLTTNLEIMNGKLVEHAESLRLTDHVIADRNDVVDRLGLLFKKEFPGYELVEYGASLSGSALPESDIDVSLMLNLDEGIETPDRDNILKLVNRIGKLLSENDIINQVIEARVAIVKFIDPKHQIPVDISIGNLNGYLKSKYMFYLQSLDQRVSQLALIVKRWAKSREINSSYGGTLSSFSWCLMCYNFLQTRSPPILPVIKMETSGVFKKNQVDDYFNDMNVIEWSSHKNTETLSELLHGFFHFWAIVYNYRRDVISVRTGRILSRREKKWNKKEGIAIEDPFEAERNISSSVRGETVHQLKKEFKRALLIITSDENDGAPWVELCGKIDGN